MIPLRRAVQRLVEAGNRCGVPKTARMCPDILQRCEALWAFVQVEGVAPTNQRLSRNMIWYNTFANYEKLKEG